MITFPCRCGHQFSLPDDMAGKEIQCPKCGLLRDIPKMGDLDNVDPDGTYKVSEVAPNPHELDETARLFSRKKADAEGRELDLRYPAQPNRKVEEIPLAEDEPPARPRYDPETGELVKPIELAPSEDPVNPALVPMARPMLHYATGENARPSIHILAPLRLLFDPVNVVTMFFVLLVHAAALEVLAFPLPQLGLLFLPIALGAVFLSAAHFANVIEETGPEDRDELPRFLRDLNFAEDIWLPFSRFALAVIYCFLPALIVVRLPLPLGIAEPFALALAALGTFIFPAVLLTSATSGTVLNLRPDRPWRMIGILGVRYFLLVAVFIATLMVYLVGMIGVSRLAIKGFPRFLTDWPQNYLLLIAGIYLVHYFCWTLGLIWRGWHKEFPWVLQYYHAPPPVLPSGPPGVTAGPGADRSYTDYRPG